MNFKLENEQEVCIVVPIMYLEKRLERTPKRIQRMINHQLLLSNYPRWHYDRLFVPHMEELNTKVD